MDRECNLSSLSKVNSCCEFKGTCQKKVLLDQVKFTLCDPIYIGKMQQILRKLMDSHFSNVQQLINNG